MVCRDLRHLQRILESLRAGARIRVAGVDHQRLHPVVLQVQVIDHDRGRLDLVGREHAARVADALRPHHAQVLLLARGDGGRAGSECLDPA